MSKDKDIERARQLLKKTVANGCTQGEAESAKKIAVKILAKYNLTIRDVPPEETRRRPHVGRSAYQDIQDEMENLARDLYREVYRRREVYHRYASASAGASTGYVTYNCPNCGTSLRSSYNNTRIVFDTACANCFHQFTVKNPTRPNIHYSQKEKQRSYQEAGDYYRKRVEEESRKAQSKAAESYARAQREMERRAAEAQRRTDERVKRAQERTRQAQERAERRVAEAQRQAQRRIY